MMDDKEKELVRTLNKIIHDKVVVMQSAWIEWKNGEGAEAAMQWIENDLWGPGQIPEDDKLFYDDAKAWFAAYRSDPFPTCWCGMPSTISQDGKGWCCEEHRLAKESIFKVKKSA